MAEQIRPKFPISFETERLIIRAPEEVYAETVNDAIQESFSELSKWMPWAKQLPSFAETKAYLNYAAQNYEKGESFDMLLFEKSTGRYIGTGGFPRLDWTVPKFEIGYWLRSSAVGQGFMLEAVNKIVDVGFLVLSAKRLQIDCDSTNTRSTRVAERAGFELEGCLRNHRLRNDGSVGDTLVYAKVAAESNSRR